MIQIILLGYICETDTPINTTAPNTMRLLSNTMVYNSAYHRILCLQLMLLGVKINARWRMCHASNDSHAGLPFLLQVFYSSMDVT